MRLTKSRLCGLLVAALLVLVAVYIEHRSPEPAATRVRIKAGATQAVRPEASQLPPRPAAGLVVVRAFQNGDGASRGANPSLASVRSEDDDLDDEAMVTDILEPSLVFEDDDARAQSAVERAEVGLESLRQQAPDGFLQLFSLMEASQRFSKPRIDQAREATRVYLERRAQLLEQSWRRFIDSHGEQTDGPELSELREIERAFRERMARYGSALPGAEELASLIAATSHPLPFFVGTHDS